MTSEADYATKQERKKFILGLMENGDWQGVLEYYDKPGLYREPLLVWIRPSLESLQFIERCLSDSLGVSKVSDFLKNVHRRMIICIS